MSGDIHKRPANMEAFQVLRRKAGEVQSHVVDDPFNDYYSNSSGVQVLQPPFSPESLVSLATNSSMIWPCIDAMEVNIAGTGGEVLRVEDDEEDEFSKDLTEGIFSEPYPGQTFTELSRSIRRDLEEAGMAYIEVIRALDDSILFLRRMDPVYTRLVRLDDPVTVTRTVRRGGKDVEVRMRVRERRVAQIIGTNVSYFSEYGASREVNVTTGEWLEEGDRVKRGNEVIILGNRPYPGSSYCVPRWIPQIPSILGARGAEELNLEFFDNGGIPPVIFMLLNGAFTPESRDSLESALSGKAKDKLNGVVVETIATGGSIESGGKVDLKVEKFGAEMAKDSMFGQYDDRCEMKIRRSFRLPPIFTGMSEDYTYATAYASYTVAEEQVFNPERLEFDQTLKVTILRDESLGGGKYWYRSNPLTVKDSSVKVELLKLAVNAVDNEELVDAINEVGGMSLTAKEDADLDNIVNQLVSGLTTPPEEEGQDQVEAQKSEGQNEVARLSRIVVEALVEKEPYMVDRAKREIASADQDTLARVSLVAARTLMAKEVG